MNHEVRLHFHLSIIGKMRLLCIVIENIFPKGLQDDFPFPCGLQIISKKWECGGAVQRDLAHVHISFQ
jgi:hypothetical protein